MTTDHDDTGGTDEADRSGGAGNSSPVLDRLRAILETLDEIDTNEDGTRRESGHLERGQIGLDYSYEVSIGSISGDRSPAPPRESDDDSESPLFEVRAVSDTDRVVVIDLSQTADGELDVRLDSEQRVLELRVDGDRIRRIPLDTHDVTVSDVTQNNQILQIRLTQPDDPDDTKHDDQ
ncbi:MAG: GvpH [uncultured archaeon A07HR60]|nr:MAG: GvpH [uncultured archaeon A07HR60]